MKRIIRWLFVLCCIAGSFIIGFKVQKTEYVYVKSAQTIKIDDPRLISAIIKAESNGNPKAVSKKGAYGLMQVRYEVHKNKLKKMGIHKPADLFNPKKNIEAGKSILLDCWYMSKGDMEKTLQMYSGNAKWYAERVLYYAMNHE